jgi:Uma2 family endonuclease
VIAATAFKIANMVRAYAIHQGSSGAGCVILPVAPLSTEQYLRMIDAGDFDSSERVELIGGYITPKFSAKPKPTDVYSMLAVFFASLADKFTIATAARVVVDGALTFEPEFALLRAEVDASIMDQVKAGDVLLVVDAVELPAADGKQGRLQICAAAGIAEYWLVDLSNNRLEVHRNPVSDIYTAKQSLGGNDTVSSLACPEMKLYVGSFFE